MVVDEGELLAADAVVAPVARRVPGLRVDLLAVDPRLEAEGVVDHEAYLAWAGAVKIGVGVRCAVQPKAERLAEVPVWPYAALSCRLRAPFQALVRDRRPRRSGRILASDPVVVLSHKRFQCGPLPVSKAGTGSQLSNPPNDGGWI